MNDTQQILRLNEHASRHQKIGMFRHRSRKRILNWNYSGSDRAALHSIKHLYRSRTRHNREPRQHPFRGFVTERAQFPLDRNSHMQGKVSGETAKEQIISTWPLHATAMTEL